MRSRFLESLRGSLRLGLLAAACVAPLAAQTTVQWQAPVSGNWFTAANWNPAVVPDAASPNTYRAVVSATGAPYLVTASGSTHVDLAGFDVSSADARVFFDFTSTNFGLTLASGSSTWSAGLVEFGTARLIGAGNTATTLNLGAAAELRFTTNPGFRAFNSLGLNNSGLIRATTGVVSLSSVVLNNQAGGVIAAEGGEFFFQSNVTLNNAGILRADGAGSILRFQQSSLTTAALGAVEVANGGRALLQGTIVNTGDTLDGPAMIGQATTGSYEFLGGTIVGGNIAAGALTFASSTGTFSGATLLDHLLLPASTSLIFTGGASFNGANLTLGNSAALYWRQNGSLTGKTITQGTSSLILLQNANNALTLGVGTTVTGDVRIYSDGSADADLTNHGIITHTGGSGLLRAPEFTNTGTIAVEADSLTVGNNAYVTLNSGSIVASNPGTFVYLDGMVDNNGILRAQDGAVLRFTGNNTVDHLGTVQLSNGGRAQLNGTLANGGTLNGPTVLGNPDTPGSYELLGGTISGGVIAAGALAFTSSNGFLSGTTLQGDLTVPGSTYVTLRNGATFTGTNLTLGGSAQLHWNQAGTLAGKALSLGGSSLLYLTGAGSALTLANDTTTTGDVRIISDGNILTSLTTQGSILHSGGSGQLYASSFLNSGTITASAGTLALGANPYATTNTGTIAALGSGTLVTLQGAVDNDGTLLANGGILRFAGSNATPNLGAVQLSNGGRAQLNGTLDNIGQTLTGPTILGNPNTPGSYELLGGTIAGGTIAAGALTFTSSNGTLSGATLLDDLLLPASSTYVTLANGASFTGTNLTLGSSTQVHWQQTGTLANKTLTFGASSLLYVTGANVLTLGNSSTATGDIRIHSDGANGGGFANEGTLVHTGGSGHIYARSFVNAGAVEAIGGSLAIGIDSASYPSFNDGTVVARNGGTLVTLNGPVDNNGAIVAQDGAVVRFAGSNTTANLGHVRLVDGGRAQLNGSLDNAASLLEGPVIPGNPDTRGSYELLGATINGGTIAAGALTFTSSTGTLSGAVLDDHLLLPGSTYVALAGGASFTGQNLTLGSSAQFHWRQDGALSGKAITLGSGALLYVAGVNSRLTLAGNSTVTGDIRIHSDGNDGTTFTNQGAITHTAGNGHIYAREFLNSGTLTAQGGTLTVGINSSSYAASNAGTIRVRNSGTVLTLDGSVDNDGTLIAEDQGILRFSGSTSTAHLGAIQLVNGGRVQLNGALNNAGDTLAAFPALQGVYELLGGTITGGTIEAGALTYTSSSGTLSGVTLAGDLTLPSSTYVSLAGGTTVGGNFTLGSSAYVYWQQAGTLTGKSISMGNGSLIYLSGGTNRSLTFASDTTATGTISIYTDGNLGNDFTNEGTLNHTGGSGQIFARQALNGGVISATGGTLNLGVGSSGYAFSNAADGTLHVSGASLVLNAPPGEFFANAGLIHVQSGTLFTNGRLRNEPSGVIRGAGSIAGGMTLHGGTLEPGNSLGTLTLTGGTFSIDAATTFAFELSGSSADRLVFANPAAPVDLGAGLVTLSLTLLGAPTPDTSFELLRISSGGSGIAGTFANLPVNGSTLSADFGGTSYLFFVNYQANAVTLHSIPEPGTWALMGAGVVALLLLSRRRRRG